MNISIVSLFPDLYTAFLNTSLMKRAQEKGQISVELTNLFAYVNPKKRIDGPTFGPGAGVLIRPDIIEKAVHDREAKKGSGYKIFFSPHGTKLDQKVLEELAQEIKTREHVMLFPARYEGMDARVEECYADKVISIGDYVLMGGDIPAMVLLEGLLRLLPGIVGKQESVEQDSFSDAFVDYPEYTEPVVWNNMQVPEIVRSGNHKKISEWRQEQAVERTVFNHFDWLRTHIHKKADIELVKQKIPAHYAVLMHADVLLPNGMVGTSSVTSLDIHDIGRSARTFGIKKYFIVTPLEDQQKIIKKLIGFWLDPVGIEYNQHRHEALSHVVLVNSLDEVIAWIEREESKKPLLLATGAKRNAHAQRITYHDQDIVWKHEQPVVFIFGTARGLSEAVMQKCDYLLEPIEGFSAFNHLSVRSAAAIIFDRWLGINRIIVV
jgi:tRNA (guanine37-N1)-methyltransferase